MKQRVYWIALAAVAALGLLSWLVINGERAPKPVQAGAEAELEIATPTPAPPQRVILLFAGRDGMLHPELRSVPLPEELEARLRVVVTEVLKGPAGGLAPVVPYPAELHAAFLSADGTAYLDLTPPPDALYGSNTELMLGYGLVNSVLLNCTELSRVQLLFGGQEVNTLTGHLDLSRPLVLNKRFIASS